MKKKLEQKIIPEDNFFFLIFKSCYTFNNNVFKNKKKKNQQFKY